MEDRAAYTVVDALIRTGQSFEHIEAFIDEQVLDRDVANALWLLAWSEAADAQQRRDVIRELLA